jgi:assimilatory nitrate reductase catalytic subunit
MADKGGLKAVDLFKAIEEGKVKAVWVIATNPVVSLPDADQVRRALDKCELVVSSDIMQNTDTTAYADVLLPALGWGEKDGTVTNSERRISRQRAFLPAPGEALPDWKILSLFAQRMGYSGFDFCGQHGVFDEHARLSGFRNAVGDVPRAFDMSGLGGLKQREYDDMEPTQWPVRRTASGELQVEMRLFKDNVYAHPDGKARFIATAPRAPHAVSEDYPLSLNTAACATSGTP